MTPKQDLLAHLEAQHGYHQWSKKATHELLAKAHEQEHAEKHLTHDHSHAGGYFTGVAQVDVTITLSPPKNPSASRNGDRNWTLHIAHLKQGRGWRYEMPGTRAGDPEGAINEANKMLGWVADWEPVGWGWKVMDA